MRPPSTPSSSATPAGSTATRAAGSAAPTRPTPCKRRSSSSSRRAAGLLERGDVKVGGFLFGTLRFKILRALSAREVPEEDAGADVPFSGDDGLTTLLHHEEATRLMHHLERVCNPVEQEVMVGYLEDRADAEIAAELGITPGHVRVVRCRARAKLSVALQA